MKFSFTYLSFYILLSVMFLTSLIVSFLSHNWVVTEDLSITYIIIISIILLFLSLTNLNISIPNAITITCSLFGSVFILITLNLPISFNSSLNPNDLSILSNYYLFIYTFALFFNFCLLLLSCLYLRFSKNFRLFICTTVVFSLIISCLFQFFAYSLGSWVGAIGRTPFVVLSILFFIGGCILCFMCCYSAYKFSTNPIGTPKSIFINIFLFCHVILLLFGLRTYYPITQNIFFLIFELLICLSFLYILIRHSFIEQYYSVTDKLDIHEKNNVLLTKYLESMAKSHDLMSKQYLEIDARYTQMIHFYPDPLFIIKKHTINQVNAHAILLLHYEDTTKLLNQPFSNFIHSDDLPHFNQTLESLFEKPLYQCTIELRMVTQHDTHLDVSMSITLSHQSNMLENTYIVSVHDLSLQKQKDQLAKQVELEKMKVEFFSTISHELKTPVNIIYSAIQLQSSLQKHRDYEKAFAYHPMIIQNCLRLLRLLNNILDINRIESDYFTVSPKLINITQFTESIVTSTHPYASKKGLSTTFDTNDEEVYVSLDPDLYERTLLNLISNAIKYSKDNGSIFISVTRQGNQVIIAVKDDGVGIPPQALSSIFTRFARVENGLIRKAEGAGIGLSLVKSFTKLNKGTINVESTVDKGTCFTLTFSTDSSYTHLAAFDPSSPSSEKLNIELSDIFL